MYKMHNILRIGVRLVQRDIRMYKHKSTADVAEVQKFNTFTDQHNWYASEVMRPLRNLNKLRVPLVCDQLTHRSQNPIPLNGFHILDVGCGGGLLSEPLARLGAQVTGLDPNINNVELAQKHANKFNPQLLSNLQYINKTVEDFKGGPFDAIIASEVIEHVQDVNLFIQHTNRLLKHGGKLIITTINKTLSSYLLAIQLAENVLNLAPKGTHSYEKLVSPTGLELILTENEFHVDLIQGMLFNPITKDWSWCSNTSMNYAVVATKL